MYSPNMSKDRQVRAERVAHAIEAAVFLEQRREIEPMLAGIDLSTGSDAPIDELWLAGELAYRHGDFGEAQRIFRAFDRHPDASRERPELRYLSLHHQCFTALQLGQTKECERLIERAEGLIAAEPSIAALHPDIDAMRAHLAELEGDFATASALFKLVFDHATAGRYWIRAFTAASDLARIAMIVGEPGKGLEWIARMREIPDCPSRRAADAMRVREAMLYAMLGDRTHAMGIFTDVVDAVGVEPDARIDAIARRADLRRQSGDLEGAELDLRQAILVARQSNLKRHEAYAHKDLASLYADLSRSEEAAHEFQDAARCVLALDPPPLLLLRQLLADLLAWPMLSGRHLRSERIRRVAEALEASERPSAYQRAARAAKKARALQDAVDILRQASSEPIVLRGCEINIASGIIRLDGGRQASRSLRPAERELLLTLAKHGKPMRLRDLRRDGDRTPAALEKTMSRLRHLLPPGAITVQRKGRQPASYRLHLRARGDVAR
jgi:tetratricopeptide (TPR) repeat protein